MRVDVYKNLHKRGWSIRSRETENYGKVIGVRDQVAIKDVEFIVQPAGNEKAKETGQRNVHAFARGELIDYREPTGDMRPVRYDPLHMEQFHCQDEPIYESPLVVCKNSLCLAKV